MKTIKLKELQDNIDSYIEMGIEEAIEVTDNDKVLFYITPKRIKLLSDVESLFGSLPKEAYYDKDIDRE